MKVRELLRGREGRAITVDPRTEIDTAIDMLMRHHIGGMPVVTLDGEIVGFLAEREIVRALHEQPGEDVRHLTVDRLMRSPPPLCRIDDSLNDVMVQMTRNRWRHLVVLEGHAIAGILSLGDIVKQRLEQAELEAGVLRDYVAAQRAR